VKKVTRTIF